MPKRKAIEVANQRQLTVKFTDEELNFIADRLAHKIGQFGDKYLDLKENSRNTAGKALPPFVPGPEARS